MHSFLEGTSDCVFLLGRDWRFTYLNRRAIYEIADGEDLLGQVIWDVFSDARGTSFEENYRRAMEYRVQVGFESYFAPLHAWYEVNASPLKGGGLGVWFRNINKRKETSDALIAAEERFRLAARATQNIIYDWNITSDVILWNEAPNERLGNPAAELATNLTWWLVRVHPDDRERTSNELQRVLKGAEERFVCEYRFLKTDGSYADVLERGFVRRDEDGFAVRMVGVLQDNTSRNKTHRDLQQREAHLSAVFGQAMVGILHRRLDGELLMINSRYCEILGRSEEDLRHLEIAAYTHPDDLRWNDPNHYERIKSGEPVQTEKRYVRPDGSIVWCEVHVSCVPDADGQPASVVVIATDISARKQVEQELTRSEALNSSILNSSPDCIKLVEPDGTILYVNPLGPQALEIEDAASLLGACWFDLLPSEVAERARVAIAKCLKGGAEHFLAEVPTARGNSKWFDIVATPVRLSQDRERVLLIARDITTLKAAEQALSESEALYRSVLETSADCIKIIDLEGRIQLMNAPGLKAMELECIEMVRGANWAELWPDEGRTSVRAAMEQACSGKLARFSAFCPTALGNPKWWDVVVTPMCNENEQVTSLLSISRDVTAQHEASAKLEWAGKHDPLTELPNRRAFQAHLEAVSKKARETGGTVGLLLIDLDHFKHVNDTLGHAAGDHLLKEAGRRLRESVRKGDFVARLGGDEFAIVLEGSSPLDLAGVGNSILSRLHRPVAFEHRSISTGASIGAAMLPEDANSATELFNHADIALYALKQSGRGGTKTFEQQMRDQIQVVSAQLSLARTAVTEQSVEPHYQPKIDLRTGEIIGFEALLRWHHPSRGLQTPDTVAEAFKNYELASKIGDLMQQRVFQDLRTWLDQKLLVQRVALNVAPVEFVRDDFAERLLARLEDHSIPPSLVEIEITEQVFFERGADYVRRALELLNWAGVRIALDDFGTGYSSLTHLRDFPVDVVKIDRSFVDKMPSDPETAAIVSAVIGLARSLKIEVVAEGVETDQQKHSLVEKGCALGQGYLFGRAVPADEVRRLLRSSAVGHGLRCV